MADDVQKPAAEAVIQVIKELNSGFYHAGGPKKEILGVTMVMATSDPTNNDITALVDVSAYQESPYGDSANTKCSFDLTLAEVRALSDAAPEFRGNFAAIAMDMTAQLQKDRIPFLEQQAAADAARVEKWCDDGLPTTAPTAVGPPLKLRRRPDSW